MRNNHRAAISRLRDASRFMRGVAALVVVSFATLIVSPTVMAVQTAPHAPAPKIERDEAKLAKTIQKTQRKLTRMAEKLTALGDVTAELAELRALREDIAALDARAMAGFEAIRTHIQRHGLPQTILQRHQAAVADYRSQAAELLQDLHEIQAAPSNAQRRAKVEKTRARLSGKKHKQAHQPIDPDNPGNRRMRPKPDNLPKLRKEQFNHAGLFDTPYPRLAALGEFTFDKLAGASDPAYLTATPEIRLSQAVRDRAAALDHDPVRIYHWVRNNVEWLPSWGAMQDADLTLASRRGNSMDIAGLTIALLRASGIPARYIHGTIEVPKEQFINWTGDFASIDAAQEYANVGGIPATSVTRGGVITKMRLEHVWVEAAIDYYPSRGARNYIADRWVQFDPSYKQYAYQQGIDAVAVSGIDPQRLAQDFSASGTINESQGWVAGLDAGVLQAAQAQAQTALETHIDKAMSDPTVSDIIGGRRTIVQDHPILPSALPNRVITVGARYGELPDALRYQMRLAFGTDILGQPLDPSTYTWARLNNHKLTLSFRPATADDEAVLASLLPEGEVTDLSQLPSTIPAYLIRVIPELKLNGEIIKQGAPMALGEDLELVFQVKTPLETQPAYTYIAPSGSYLNVAVIGQSVSTRELLTLQARLDNTKTTLESNDPAGIAALTREELLGDMFYAGTLGYFAQYNTLSHIAAISQRHSHNLAIGYGSFGYEPHVEYLFGIPRFLEAGGAVMNVRLGRFIGTHTNDPEQVKRLNLQTGMISSALEHAVPEQMFTTDPDNPADAVSAVKAIQKAAQQGQRIYQISQANSATALPNIHHDPETMGEITAALAVGKEVITHTDPIAVPGWRGAGYIILDPETGDGSYKIGGGINGGVLIALNIVISLAELFYDALTAIAATLKAKVPILNSVSNFIKLANFVIGILKNGLQCNGFGAIALVMTLFAISGLLIAQIITSLSNPIAAFGLGVMFDKASGWLIEESNNCNSNSI